MLSLKSIKKTTLQVLKNSPNKTMMTKSKKKFINVSPLSKIAQQRFINDMANFHACIVLDENEKLYHLLSLNGMYEFHVQKNGNEHWKISK
jgi:hypothetical protein